MFATLVQAPTLSTASHSWLLACQHACAAEAVLTSPQSLVTTTAAACKHWKAAVNVLSLPRHTHALSAAASGCMYVLPSCLAVARPLWMDCGLLPVSL